MITVITCSVKPDVCQKMLDSVSKTIGTQYETIVFDNREKQYGICKAYNEAATNANGEYFCFVHEDTEIKTFGWGKNLVEFVNQTENCGVVGLAGGHCALKNFIAWWANEDKTNLINIYESNCPDNNEFKHTYNNPNNEIFSKAVCIDGVFLFVKKEIWLQNKFDENIFKGFHFYDADFSFAISRKYQNYVYFGMDVCHFSSGNMERTFCENMHIFQAKWKNYLPYCLPGYKVSLLRELKTACQIFALCRKNKFSKTKIFKKIYEINGVCFFLCFFVFCPIFFSAKKILTFYRKLRA